jgi:beta-xylosidase
MFGMRPPSFARLPRRLASSLLIAVWIGSCGRAPASLSEVAPPPTVVEPTVRAVAPEPTLPPPPPAATPSPVPTPGGEGNFRDDFDKSLDPGWSWSNQDIGAWSLSASPGWLRITLSTGGFISPSPPSNVLLRPAPATDFEIRTHLSVQPTQDFEIAGLVILFDANSALQFGRGFCNNIDLCMGDGYYFDNIQAGSPSGSNMAAPGRNDTQDQLRLVRRGDRYTAYYLIDGATWNEVGTHQVSKPPQSVGLIAAQAPSFGLTADFDFFDLILP